MAAPVADFTAGLITVTSWHVQFTDLSTNTPTSWAWDFGDGDTSTAQNPIHDYTTGGTYTVSLTATNADGSDAEVKVGYIFMSPFFPEFSGTPLTGTEPLSVAFTDLTPGSPSSWFWHFGDGGTSFLQNPTHNYVSAGTYSVDLTAGNGSAGTTQKLSYVVVSPAAGGGGGGGPATGLYVTHGGFGAPDTNLYSLDPDTMVLTVVGDTGHLFTGLAVDPTDTTMFYGVTGNLGAGQRRLFQINADTGGVTNLGELGTTIADITFDASGQLYGWKVSTRRLCTIDKATGAVVEVGSSGLGSASGNGLAVDPVDDNKVWLFPQGGSGDIYTINKTTGAATDAGYLFPSVTSDNVGAAAFDADGVLWGIGTGGDLFTVGALVGGEYPETLIGSLPDDPWDGMAWSPGATPPPTPTGPATRAAFAPWRFIVTSLASETLSILDNRSTGRRAVFTLNAPAYHEGQVGSDDPEINLPWPTGTSPAFLAPNTRLIYGFQREPGATPPWVCRFGGIVMSIEDEGADVPTSRYTAYDPWQLLMSRPIRNPGTPFALPGVDGLTFASGSRASDIAGLLLLATELEDGETHIDVSDLSLIHDTDPLGADITFDQGTSVGEAWQQLCDTGTLDIVLEPMYEPITAPGKLVRFSTWKPPNALTPEAGGTLRADAVMGWDRAGKSLTGISRLIDGTRLANVVQFYANQLAVPVQSDAASIAAVGQYWAQQFFPGVGNDELVALMAVAELAIRRNGQRSISLDPGPERTFVALRDYGLRDYVPVWASKRLREPLGIDYAAFNPDIPSGAGYLRIYQIPIEISDDGSTLVRGIMTGKDVG